MNQANLKKNKKNYYQLDLILKIIKKLNNLLIYKIINILMILMNYMEFKALE